jgi:adenylate cyclase
LGRSLDNDVVLAADEVSRSHARLTFRNGRWLLKDLESLNGAYVNGQRIVERALNPGDEIWLGSKCRLLFMAGADEDTGSTLDAHLTRIRQEMDQVRDNMTYIGRTGGQSPAQVSADDIEKVGRAYRRLNALYEVSKLMAGAFDLDERLGKALDAAMREMEAERGFIMLRDESDGELTVRVARQMSQELAGGSPSMSIAGKAARTGQPVLMTRGPDDSEFGGRDSVVIQRITAAMCAPLRVEHRVIGSIYLDTRSAAHRFTPEDLELFTALAAQAAMAVDHVRLHETVVDSEKKRADLSRFLSPGVVETILQGGLALELGGQKREVTTLFCDIRGFTPLAETMEAQELVDLLNEHFTTMTEIVFRYGGTLDKYIGDELMAVWGSPLSNGDDACRAVRAALEIRDANAKLNAARRERGQNELEIGIGLETGEVIAGCMGSPERMEFTVVGDHVNTARRLCSLAEGGQIVLGPGCRERVGDAARCSEIGARPLKGKQAPVEVYELTGDDRGPETLPGPEDAS